MRTQGVQVFNPELTEGRPYDIDSPNSTTSTRYTNVNMQVLTVMHSLTANYGSID